MCTVPVMFSYWAQPEHTVKVSQQLNNDLAEQCRKYPRRFIGLATVPMNDPTLAAAELKRCVQDLGM
jgi:aminocarboxymuconate-semialdehyde decarboxylase